MPALPAAYLLTCGDPALSPWWRQHQQHVVHRHFLCVMLMRDWVWVPQPASGFDDLPEGPTGSSRVSDLLQTWLRPSRLQKEAGAGKRTHCCMSIWAQWPTVSEGRVSPNPGSQKPAKGQPCRQRSLVVSRQASGAAACLHRYPVCINSQHHIVPHHSPKPDPYGEFTSGYTKKIFFFISFLRTAQDYPQSKNEYKSSHAILFSKEFFEKSLKELLCYIISFMDYSKGTAFSTNKILLLSVWSQTFWQVDQYLDTF